MKFKKSLVGAASLLVASVSFAQVTVSGAVQMGYQSDNSATGAASSGLGVNRGTDAPAALVFTAKEDLGSGQKVEAMQSFANTDRVGAKGGDTTLKYTNNAFGQIALDSSVGGLYFVAVTEMGLPFITMDGKVADYVSANDDIKYTVPIGPVYAIFNHTEGKAGLGLGVGSTGSSTGSNQNYNQISIYYPSGNLTALGSYRAYDNQQSLGTVSGVFPASVIPFKTSLLNLQASYNFGAFKLGGGFQQVNTVMGAVQTDYEVVGALPLGSWTLGALFGQSQTSSAAATATILGAYPWNTALYNGTAPYMGVVGTYAFSKSTSLTLRYASWNTSGYIQYANDAGTLGAKLGAGAFPAPGTPVNGIGGLSWSSQTANQSAILLTQTF